MSRAKYIEQKIDELRVEVKADMQGLKDVAKEMIEKLDKTLDASKKV